MVVEFYYTHMLQWYWSLQFENHYLINQGFFVKNGSVAMETLSPWLSCYIHQTIFPPNVRTIVLADLGTHLAILSLFENVEIWSLNDS